MAQKRNLLFKSKIETLVAKNNFYQNRHALYIEYGVEESERIRQHYAKKLKDATAHLERQYQGIVYDASDKEPFARQQVEQLVAKKQASLRMDYRVEREKTRRAIAKLGTENEAGIAELNNKLAAYEAELAEKLQQYHNQLTSAVDARRERGEFAGKQELDLTIERQLIDKKIEAVKQDLATKEEQALAKFKKANDKRIDQLLQLKEKTRQQIDDYFANAPQNAYDIPDGVVLRATDLCKYFGGVKAVNELTFDVKEGEIFGLIGPNGAGKTTVFNCITQFSKPTKGELYFRTKVGEVINLNDEVVHNVILRGIVRTFQNLEVIKEISVLENLLVAAHRQYQSNLFEQMLHLPILKMEEKVIRRRAEKVLEFMGLLPYKNYLAWGLPYGVLKKLEIARTLMFDPQLIILDEPAAGLNDSETVELAALIKRIQQEYKCTILLVEHDMGLVMDICDTILAISFGRKLAIGTPAEIQANKDVQAAYLGLADDETKEEVKDGATGN